MSQPQQSAEPERIIDARYRVVRLLGEGGFGQVFECRHVGTRRPFAVKLLLPEIARRPGVLTRFLREAQTAGCIKSAKVVDVIDVGQCRSTNAAFMAMELLDGHDLAKQLERGPLAPELVLRVAAQALAGLCAAHAEGVVHRDIKPPNLFLARSGGGQRIVKVLDFGIAKVLGEDNLERAKLTVTGSILGSPWYMSPEQANGSADIDHRSDIWSLGAVMYEALAGVTAYHGVTTLQQLLRQICEGPPPPVSVHAPQVAPGLAAIVTKAMAHNPADRYRTAQEMLDAVTALLDGPSTISDAMLGVVDGAPAAAEGGRESMSDSGHTQPMRATPALVTQGALARSVEKAPQRRTYVIGTVAVVAVVGLAAVALKFVPRPGNHVADAQDAAVNEAADSGGREATPGQTKPARAPVAPPVHPRSEAPDRDAGAPEDAGGADAAVTPRDSAPPKHGGQSRPSPAPSPSGPLTKSVPTKIKTID